MRSSLSFVLLALLGLAATAHAAGPMCDRKKGWVPAGARFTPQISSMAEIVVEMMQEDGDLPKGCTYSKHALVKSCLLPKTNTRYAQLNAKIDLTFRCQGKPLTTRVHSRCDVGRSGRIDNVRYNVVWMKA